MTSSLLPLYRPAPFVFVRGEGTSLFTEDGRRFLDFGAGIAVNALGHAHPKLVAALTEQASKLWHTSNLYRVPGQERLADKLVNATFAEKVFFCNSGAEALECAIKMARRYHYVSGAPERYRLITFEGAFHGRTLATIAAGGQDKYLEGFGPPVEGFDQVPFGDLEAVKAAIGPETAGILLEPIQGEGGLRAFPHADLRALRSLCDEHGLLLINDEVQCGMGRTGRLFAHEWADAPPDIMAVAKALGAGFPVGACLATDKAASGMTTGVHGTTFGGNPLAMAVGEAAFDILSDADFLKAVEDKGLRLKQRLASLVDLFPDVFEEVRGAGLMLGLKLKPSIENRSFVAALAENALLTVPAGDNVVRLLPPLTITEDESASALEILEQTAAQVREGAPNG